MDKIIKKSSENSYFLIMHIDSTTARILFNTEPKHRDNPINILQVMTLDKGVIMVEIAPTGNK